MGKRGKKMQAKLINIGNSKGIRLPKKIIEKYHLHDILELEERKDGILIRQDNPDDRLSWEETYREMVESDEEWSDLDKLADDGLEQT